MKEDSSTNTISVIDLIAVFLKYRRITISVLFLSIIIGVVAIFIYPEKKYDQLFINNKQTVTAEAFYQVSPNIAPFIGEEDFSRFIYLTLADPDLIISSAKEAGLSKLAGVNLLEENRSVLISNVRQNIIYNELIFSLSIENVGFKLSIKSVGEDYYIQFFNIMLNLANNKLRSILLPIAEAEVNKYQDILNSDNIGLLSDEISYDFHYNSTSAISFTQLTNPILLSVQSPYILIEKDSLSLTSIRKSFIKTVVIFVVLIEFLAVLFTFVLYWVENVRNDKESMDKLKSALSKK